METTFLGIRQEEITEVARIASCAPAAILGSTEKSRPTVSGRVMWVTPRAVAACLNLHTPQSGTGAYE